MTSLLFALGAHLAAVIVGVAASGVGEDDPVSVGLVVPWASGLVGCALVVAQGIASSRTPWRIASALQAVAIGGWAIWTRAPIDSGGEAIAASVATIVGAGLATLPHRGS